MSTEHDTDLMAGWIASGEVDCATCPWCGETFYALTGFDPLKRHADYCNERLHADVGDPA